MLAQLYIKNIAVISEATIDFKEGLNVFTGETGAGKTILIHAIHLALGERGSREMIRAGETQAAVSALFTGLSETARATLATLGFALEEDALLIGREISTDGKSVCRIDGRPATASILKTIAPLLVDIHGQRDNQSLLSLQKHMGFIDHFGGLIPRAAEYGEVFSTYSSTKRSLETLLTDEGEKERRMDLLRYQTSEIEQAQLLPGEEEELKANRKLIQNALTVTEALGSSLLLLDGSDDGQTGLMTLFQQLLEHLSDAAKYLEGAQPPSEKATDLYYELEGVSEDLRRLLEEFDCNPARLEEIEERLDIIYRLKKKYGPDISAVLQFYAEASAELEQIATSDVRAEKLQKQLEQQHKQVKELAQKLSEARARAAAAFSKAVQDELAFLDMPSVRLAVRQQHKELSSDGADEIELMIATNLGEEPKPLAKIASGGELARIMLSIKNVMAGRGEVQTMIFDEVDTGVSGRAAQKIGRKLAQVAHDRQVIVVTHLAQVAAFGRHHLLISKATRDHRTFTTVTALTPEERVQELARITAGDHITETALLQAQELLRDAEA